MLLGDIPTSLAICLEDIFLPISRIKVDDFISFLCKSTEVLPTEQ